MASVATQELKDRLGLRRPVPPDSTAGVSFSGLADYNTNPQDASAAEVVIASTRSFSGEAANTTSLLQPISVVDVSGPDDEFSWAPVDSSSVGGSFPTIEMVFHVIRMHEPQRQDIITIHEIMDPCSGEPSCARLVELLEDESGVDLREGDFVMVNDRIHVGNERQLHACLQYLRNEAVLNSEVYVYNASKALSNMTQLNDDAPPP